MWAVREIEAARSNLCKIQIFNMANGKVKEDVPAEVTKPSAMEQPTFCLLDYDCVGFDMDHTIIQYHLPEIFQLIYNSITTYLVEKKGYDRHLFEVDFQKYEDFSLRGLTFEIKTGNFLKLGADGKIFQASHGMTMLTDEQIEKEYGKSRVWQNFPQLNEKLHDGDGYRLFENFFNMPFAVVIARIIDVIDQTKGRQKSYTFWPDIVAAATENYGAESFSIKRGLFFPSVIENPNKFVKKCPQEVIDWLKGLRSAGKITFLVTQSYADFTSFLMEYAIGKDWKNLFDVIVTNGGKPMFFSGSPEDRPFHKVTEGIKEGQKTYELEKHVVYSGGNATTFEENAKLWLGKDTVKTVYFGDSPKSDICPPKCHKYWDTVCVLEEMEAEEVHFQNNVRAGCLDCNEPAPKKPRIAPLLKEEKLLIASKQWGSFFCHNDDSSTSNGNSKEPKINTFWGHAVRTYSKISIPLLDYIATLPIDFKFQSFSDTQLGFYPSPPGTVVHEH